MKIEYPCGCKVEHIGGVGNRYGRNNTNAAIEVCYSHKKEEYLEAIENIKSNCDKDLTELEEAFERFKFEKELPE